MPGVAGNLYYSREADSYWLALIGPIKCVELCDALLRNKWLRWLMLKTPYQFLPKPEPFGGVVEIGLDG